MSAEDTNTIEVPVIKLNRPRKVRPTHQFDIAAELLMSDGRERENVKISHVIDGFIAPEDNQDADCLFQRLKAL